MSLNLDITKNRGNYITSYDLLKIAALLLMFCDHIGHFFYPDLHWLRILGRFCVPIWFFLVGYTGSRPVPKEWMVGGAVLVIADAAIGGYLFPFSVLFTFALIRIMIDPVARFATRGTWSFIFIFVLMTLLALPTTVFVEYGSYGMLCALYGYMRHYEAELRMPPSIMAAFITALTAVSVGFQALLMPALTPTEYMLMGIGMAATILALHFFQPVYWPNFGKKIPGFVPLVQFLGRWTLEIYVIHLLILRVIAYYMYPETLHFMQFRILPFGLS